MLLNPEDSGMFKKVMQLVLEILIMMWIRIFFMCWEELMKAMFLGMNYSKNQWEIKKMDNLVT